MTDNELEQAINQATEEALEAAKKLIAAQATGIELAYGLLWLCPCDRATVNGERIYQARQALLAVLDREGKLRGLRAAQDLTPSPSKMN